MSGCMDPSVKEQHMGVQQLALTPRGVRLRWPLMATGEAKGDSQVFQVEFETSKNFHRMQPVPWQSIDRPGMTT